MVYGGCVARDSFELLKDEFDLGGYVARQSLISSATPPLAVPQASTQLESAFQTRQVRGDIASNLLPQLMKLGPEADVLLMDLIVERLGVLRFRGGYVTRSNELLRTPLADRLADAPWIKFGTERHWARWTDAVDRVAAELRGAGLLEKALVLNTPWAPATRGGEPLSLRGRPSAEYNEAYRPFYAYMEQRGFTVAAMPAEYAIGDDEHKWGPAPYHYIPEAYAWIAGMVRSHADRA